MDNELWMPFPNHRRYEVSNMGRVRRADTGRVRTPVRAKNGYMTIMLTDNGKYELEYVHRAVASAFLPNPSKLEQVNHIDHDRQNNRAENLEWCTAMYNVQYSSGMPIAQYDKAGKLVSTFSCGREAERILGVSHDSIGRAARGEYKTAYGYIWRYL